MSKPAVTEILDAKTLEGFKTTDEVVFVGYIKSEDDISNEAFAAVADEYREEFTFGLVSDPTLIKSHDLEPPGVVCHVVEDGETRSLNSFAEPKALRSFVLEASRRAIGDLLPYDHLQQRLVDVSRPHIVYMCEAFLTKSHTSVAGQSSTSSGRRKTSAQSYGGRCINSPRATTTP